MREAAKSHHALKKEVETRLKDMRVCYDQMVTKIPSELSKRLQKAQAASNGEIEALGAPVLTLEAFYNAQRWKGTVAASSSYRGSHMDVEQQKLLEGVKTLRKEANNLRGEYGSHFTRIDADLLGLYDWTREKVASVRGF